MSDETHSELDPTPVEFKDRKTSLVVFEILTLLGGCLCGLFVPLTFLGQMMSERTTGIPANYASVLPTAGVYGSMAVALVWLGIGSIQAKRWARALLLIFSWSWLIMGLFSLLGFAMVVPRIAAMVESTAPPGGQLPPGTVKLLVILIPLLFIMVFLVVLPGIWILFYRGRSVKLTCEARDLEEPWTDRCPLQVLGISIWLWLGVPMLILMPVAYHGAMPLFGTFISGGLGALAYALLAIVWAYCAWGFFKLQPRAWWTLVFSLILLSASTILTYLRKDLDELYFVMGYTDQQIAQLQQFSPLTATTLVWGTIVFTGAVLGYLVYVRRYFRTPISAIEKG